MPSVSGKQHRAMEAAAHGKSTLGIPKAVGQEFATADAGKSAAKKKRAKHSAKRVYPHLPSSDKED